jgi:hypothetical protein
MSTQKSKPILSAREILDSTSNEIIISNTDANTLDAFFSTFDPNNHPTIRIIASKDTLDAITETFPDNARLKGYVLDNDLKLKTLPENNEEHPHSPAIVAGDDVYIPVYTGSKHQIIPAPETETTSELRDVVTSTIDAAKPFSFRVPAYRKIEEEFTETVSEACFETLEKILDAADGFGHSTNISKPTTAILLAAAAHEEQNYHTGQAAEDSRFASKAKMSREKRKLEDRNLLETEKIPKDIGRPRQRLTLNSTELGPDPDPETIAQKIQSL